MDFSIVHWLCRILVAGFYLGMLDDVITRLERKKAYRLFCKRWAEENKEEAQKWKE